jgi:alkanesulfonate monooxygenase SsuD/methylene tetrahydromethanopterin reductase-like flavin-dependent oxidoreductase (luciferase family)
MAGNTADMLAEKIAVYRTAREVNGFVPETGIVSVMLHTYVGHDIEVVKQKVRGPFQSYLRSAVLHELAGASGKGGAQDPERQIAPEVIAQLLDLKFEWYFRNATLMGTPDTCQTFVERLAAVGVDEVACLVDFGLEESDIFQSLELVRSLPAFEPAPERGHEASADTAAAHSR